MLQVRQRALKKSRYFFFGKRLFFHFIIRGIRISEEATLPYSTRNIDVKIKAESKYAAFQGKFLENEVSW